MPFNAPGTRSARNIDYDDGATNLAYATAKYHYNNIGGMLRISKMFDLENEYKLVFGLEANTYYTISQQYDLGFNNRSYASSNKKPLEFGYNMTVGIRKELETFYISPTLLLPIFQNLKGDHVFMEDRNMNISKWFHGIGIQFVVGRYIR